MDIYIDKPMLFWAERWDGTQDGVSDIVNLLSKSSASWGIERVVFTNEGTTTVPVRDETYIVLKDTANNHTTKVHPEGWVMVNSKDGGVYVPRHSGLPSDLTSLSLLQDKTVKEWLDDELSST